MIFKFNSLLHARISTVVLISLAYVALSPVILFSSRFPRTSYEHILKENLERELYRNTSSFPDTWKPQCSYKNILASEVKYDTCVPDCQDKGSVHIPDSCDPIRIALVVPLKNLTKELSIFLPHMHMFLQQQKLHYKIFVVESVDRLAFNKGVLLNVGSSFAISEGFPCLILHDVDLLPLDAGNLYACLQEPRHISTAIQNHRYALPYEELVGGVLAIRSAIYEEVDGYSNQFYGWGGEDDEFYYRLVHHNHTLKRFPIEKSRYTMLRHKRQPENVLRWEIRNKNMRNQFRGDGLSTVHGFVAAKRVHPGPLATTIEVTLRQ